MPTAESINECTTVLHCLQLHIIINKNGCLQSRETLCIGGWRLKGEIATRNVDGILLKLITAYVTKPRRFLNVS